MIPPGSKCRWREPAGTLPRSRSTRPRTRRRSARKRASSSGRSNASDGQRLRRARRAPPARLVAPDDARAQERDPLPGGGLLAVVALERRPGGHQQPLLARGAQPGVDLIEPPLLQHRLHRGDEPLRGAREPLAVIDAGVALAVGAEEKDQIEIRSVAHLARAQAAEAEHGQRRPRLAHAAPRAPAAPRRSRPTRQTSARSLSCAQTSRGAAGSPPRRAGRCAGSPRPGRSGSRAAPSPRPSSSPRRRAAPSSRSRELARRADPRAPGRRRTAPTSPGGGPGARPADRWSRTASPACGPGAGDRAGAPSGRPSPRSARSRKCAERAIGIGRGDRLLEERHRHARADQLQRVGRHLDVAEAGRGRPAAPAPRGRASDRAAAPPPGAPRAAARPASRRSPRPPPAWRRPRRRRRPRSANPSPRAKAPAPRRRRRQPVALRAGRHLHPVLEPPPKPIGAEQRLAPRAPRGGPPPPGGGRARGVFRSRRSGRLPACEQLQRLHHHLDVADAARAELDVEPGRRRARPTRRPDRGTARAARAPPRPCAGSTWRG